MTKFTKLSICQKLIFWHQTSSHKCSMYQIVSAKAVEQVDFLANSQSMHKQNALRITKGNNSYRIGPLAFLF